MTTSESLTLPPFLRSFEDLIGHFDQHFEPLNSSQRGDAFLGFCLKLVPFTEVGRRFTNLRASEKKSHDHGVDLISDPNEEGQILCVQSRYKVPGKEELDSIVSKFADYQSLHAPQTSGQLFPDCDEIRHRHVFMIVTFSKLQGVRGAYLASHLAAALSAKSNVKRSSQPDG
jgi:hypothetical protein